MADTNDPQTPTPPPRRRGRRLARVAHVKAGLADVIRKLESGALTPKVANALVYAYSTLAGVMTSSDVESRVEALERARAAGAERARLAS